MKKTILVSVIIGVLSLVVGLFGGIAYQKTKQQTVRQNMMGQFGNGNTRNGSVSGSTTSRDALMKGNAPVNGKIISLDATSITVQTQDGSNKIVYVSDQTKVNKTTEATKTDLVVGTEVMAIGNTANGVLTAKTISLGTNPSRPQEETTPSIQTK